jgi:hypothetical protein
MFTNQFRNVANTLRFMSNRYSNDNPYGGDYSTNQSSSTSNNNNNASRPNENPERFLTQPYNPFEIADGARARIRQDNQEMLNLGNQSRNDEFLRVLKQLTAKDDSATRQNREAIYSSQQEANINQDAYERRRRFDGNQTNTSASSQSAGGWKEVYGDFNGKQNAVASILPTLDPNRAGREFQMQMLSRQADISSNQTERDAYNQRIADQQRNSQQIQSDGLQALRTQQQQAAQNAAQERLARINQQTSIMTMGAGDGGWRWF